MGAMPGMDKEDGPPPKKGIDLAIVFGKPKGKGGADAAPDSERSEAGAEGEGDGLPAGFEDAASEAFPDMAGDPERMGSLHRLIKLCSDSY